VLQRTNYSNFFYTSFSTGTTDSAKLMPVSGLEYQYQTVAGSLDAANFCSSKQVVITIFISYT